MIWPLSHLAREPVIAKRRHYIVQPPSGPLNAALDCHARSAVFLSKLRFVKSSLWRETAASTDDGQGVNVIAMAHTAAKNRILKRHLEARCRADATDCAEGAAIHDRTGRKYFLAACARDQVGWRAHRRQSTLLILDPLPANGDEGMQHEFVPMRGTFVEAPERFTDRLGA